MQEGVPERVRLGPSSGEKVTGSGALSEEQNRVDLPLEISITTPVFSGGRRGWGEWRE